MSDRSRPLAANRADSRDIGNLDRAAAARREAAWKLTMSERLTRVQELSKQINAVKGAAQSH